MTVGIPMTSIHGIPHTHSKSSYEMFWTVELVGLHAECQHVLWLDEANDVHNTLRQFVSDNASLMSFMLEIFP